MDWEMSWLVKRKHYGGGESVIARFSTLHQAQESAADKNLNYQTDNYYAEEYDTAKFEWTGK